MAACFLQDFRTVFLLNCGASIFAPELVPSSCVNVRFVVVDSHRPVHPNYNDPEDLSALFMLSSDDPLTEGEIPPANTTLDSMTLEGMGARDGGGGIP